MRLRISRTDSDTATIVQVDGRLTATAVPELERECQSPRGTLYLDLSNLVLADAEGVKALTKLAESGVRLIGESPYIRLQLGLKEDE
jgi:anti-anti-sigma regulatory factor